MIVGPCLWHGRLSISVIRSMPKAWPYNSGKSSGEHGTGDRRRSYRRCYFIYLFAGEEEEAALVVLATVSVAVMSAVTIAVSVTVAIAITVA